MEPPRHKSALTFVLLALIPYSRPNMLLAFKPNQFFNELEKISKYKRHTLEQAASRALEQGLIKKNNNQLLRLTELGQIRVLPYTAQKLPKNGKLMLIFDIPEDQKVARQRLRRLLKKWKFSQVQKSVWTTEYDYIEAINEAINALEIEDYVEVYECAPLYPKK